MSWHTIEGTENLDIGLLLQENQKITLIWTCPRCSEPQTKTVSINELFDNEFSCQNVDVCGEDQSSFELKLGVSGSYNGLSGKSLSR